MLVIINFIPEFDKKDLTCHKFNIQHKKSIEIGEA